MRLRWSDGSAGRAHLPTSFPQISHLPWPTPLHRLTHSSGSSSLERKFLVLHTQQNVETWQSKRHAGKRRSVVVPGSEVAGFFVSVQQLSFIEQGWGWRVEKAPRGKGREGGYAWAGRVETEQSALRAAFLQSISPQTAPWGILPHEWPTLSDTVCNPSQMRSAQLTLCL